METLLKQEITFDEIDDKILTQLKQFHPTIEQMELLFRLNEDTSCSPVVREQIREKLHELLGGNGKHIVAAWLRKREDGEVEADLFDEIENRSNQAKTEGLSYSKQIISTAKLNEIFYRYLKKKPSLEQLELLAEVAGMATPPSAFYAQLFEQIYHRLDERKEWERFWEDAPMRPEYSSYAGRYLLRGLELLAEQGSSIVDYNISKLADYFSIEEPNEAFRAVLEKHVDLAITTFSKRDEIAYFMFSGNVYEFALKILLLIDSIYKWYEDSIFAVTRTAKLIDLYGGEDFQDYASQKLFDYLNNALRHESRETQKTIYNKTRRVIIDSNQDAQSELKEIRNRYKKALETP